jgi:hypothetical protein
LPEKKEEGEGLSNSKGGRKRKEGRKRKGKINGYLLWNGFPKCWTF